MSGLFGITLPSRQAAQPVANPTTGEMSDGSEAPKTGSTIFDEAIKARNGGDDTAEDTDDDKEKEPVVVMPDGSKVPASQYIEAQTADQKAELAATKARLEERERFMQAPGAHDNGQSSNETEQEEKGPEKVEWTPIQSNLDVESLADTERAIAEQSNAAINHLGEQFTQVVNKLTEENYQLKQDLGKTFNIADEVRANNEYARVEAQYGVTKQEVLDVHKEYPNSFDMDLLAQVAKTRKGDEEQEEETKTQTRTERNSTLEKIGSASNERGASREDQENRASKITDWSDGAQIARHYKGLLGAPA